MLRFADGARGMLWASQVAPGNENGLRLRVYGTKGGLEWAQEDPNYLWFTPFGEPTRLITRGGAGTGAAAARVTRVPPGHPEGYLEGFANIYTGGRGRDPRRARGQEARPRRDLPDRRGRRQGRGLRRGLRPLEQAQRCLGDALGNACERARRGGPCPCRTGDAPVCAGRCPEPRPTATCAQPVGERPEARWAVRFGGVRPGDVQVLRARRLAAGRARNLL